MAFEIIIFAAVLACISAGNPQYEFGYDVQDSLTGDFKSQHEQRSGDFVQGQYSLNDADGTRRIVDYVADPINGFNANVRKEPLYSNAAVGAPAISKLATPLVSQPLLRSYATPTIAAAPALTGAPLLRSYATPVISATPFLRSYSAPALTGSSLLSSGIHAGYRYANAPALGYSSALSGIYGNVVAPTLGYSSRSTLGYSAAYGNIASPFLGYSSSIH